MKIYEIEDINTLKPGEKRKFEPSNSDKERSFSKFLSDCSESIAAMKQTNKILYRGIANPMNRAVLNTFIGRSRDKRETLDTPNEIQKIFDDVLRANNFIALRSNSIFCTSMRDFATGYGLVYLIFPINGFKYTYSPYIEDFTEFLADIHTGAQFKKFLNKRPNFISESFKQTDFETGLRSENEIMIHGQYYAFNASKYDKILRKAILK